MKTKYFAKKVKCDGHTFDSRTEYNRYVELKHLLQMGKITELELQKEFELLPKQMKTVTVHLKTKTKQVERVDEQAVKYHCDFFYIEVDTNLKVIEEVKSKATAMARDYPLRRKLVKLLVRRLNRSECGNVYEFREIVAEPKYKRNNYIKRCK